MWVPKSDKPELSCPSETYQQWIPGQVMLQEKWMQSGEGKTKWLDVINGYYKCAEK